MFLQMESVLRSIPTVYNITPMAHAPYVKTGSTLSTVSVLRIRTLPLDPKAILSHKLAILTLTGCT